MEQCRFCIAATGHLPLLRGVIYSANPKWREIANFRPITFCVAKLTWFASPHKPAPSFLNPEMKLTYPAICAAHFLAHITLRYSH